jgi:transcription-repair coupling factor (superfamily II helicase)
MSKLTSLLMPTLAKRRGKNADKKNWHKLYGSSSSVAILQAAIASKAPILVVCKDTPSALKLEQELLSLVKNHQDNSVNEMNFAYSLIGKRYLTITSLHIKILFLSA